MLTSLGKLLFLTPIAPLVARYGTTIGGPEGGHIVQRGQIRAKQRKAEQ